MKKYTFVMCTFLHARSKFVKTHALNNLQFEVDSFGVFKNYSYFQTFMFFRFQKGGENNEKRAHLESPFCAWSSQIPKGPILLQKVSPKCAHSEFWRGQRVRASWPPSFSCISGVRRPSKSFVDEEIC